MKVMVEVSYNTSTRGIATESFDGVTDVCVNDCGQLMLEGQERRLIALFNAGSWIYAKSVEVDE